MTLHGEIRLERLRGCLKTNVKTGVHSLEVDFGMN